MEDKKIADLEAITAAAKEAADKAEGKDEALNKALKDAEDALTAAKAPLQDPIKQKLEKVQKKEPRTEAEKAAYNLKMNAERVKQLGLDPKSVLGIKDEPLEGDDSKPLTVGDFKRMEMEKATKTALDLANEIEDEAERELTKVYLQDRVKPSGNPQEDLKFARAAVNSLKNAQIAELATKKVEAKQYSSGAGAPAKNGDEDEFVPTAEEEKFMRIFKLTKEDILKSRKG